MDFRAHFTRAPVRATAELRRLGVSASRLTEAVHSRELIRVRRGHYALPDTDELLLHAVRIGGRLGCVSAAARLGIWVADEYPFAHVSLHHHASRLRSPANRRVALSDDNRNGCELHWWPTAAQGGHQLGVTDALAQIVRCQRPELAIASLDSALHKKLVPDLDAVFALVPRKYRRLASRVDARCMSGIETLVRLMLERAGLSFEPQATFDGIGDVDFLVEDFLVIETDGRTFHKNEQLRDYRRDAMLAARGYVVLRFDYRQVMHDPALVMAAINGALRARRAGQATPAANG